MPRLQTAATDLSVFLKNEWMFSYTLCTNVVGLEQEKSQFNENISALPFASFTFFSWLN